MGYVPCLKKLGSPKMSSSKTTNLKRAKSGQQMSKTKVSFQMGLNPLSTVESTTVLNNIQEMNGKTHE